MGKLNRIEYNNMNKRERTYTEHLAAMIRVPAVASQNPENLDVPLFEKLHACLEREYPLLHKTLTRQRVGRAALLYKWAGTGKSAKLPLMFTAHQDVMPAGHEEKWTYPPFEAVVADGFLWGRGTTDSKCNIQAYMDSIEELIQEGFTPDYDLYIGLGYNEEVFAGPEPAARLIAEELAGRGVKLGCLIDECGGIIPGPDGCHVGSIGVCEKGYLDLRFTAYGSAGHAAQPGKHTSLGVIAQTACALEKLDMPRVPSKPLLLQLKACAPLADEKTRKLLEDPERNWDALQNYIAADPEHDFASRTTVAVTMANGSEQPNFLPEVSTLCASFRLVPGLTIPDFITHLHTVIPEGVTIEVIRGVEASPLSSTDSNGYRLISQVMEDKYPGIHMMPTLLYCGTDARYYYGVCPSQSIYRVTGLLRDGTWGNYHKENERIACRVLPENVDFYRQIIVRYGDFT